MPNPGRMQELLFKGVEILLTPMDTDRVKYPWRVCGVNSPHGWLMLDTIRNNDVASYLVENGKIPSLKDYKLIKREVTVGKSRFDMLLKNGEEELYCEVKSCTLFGSDLAMFPDAVTERGRRHVEELTELKVRDGINCAVLFIVHSNMVSEFIPDFHNDPAFSAQLFQSSEFLKVIPLSLCWSEQLTLQDEVRELPINWDIYKKHGQKDSGFYFFLMEVEEDKLVEVGALGKIEFKKGFYCYVGSAKSGLSKRVERHKRKRKSKHWHIDYLRDVSTVAGAWPIRFSGDIECEMAKKMSEICDGEIKNFGSSDCDCNSHLFFFKESPVRTRSFQDVIIWYRMGNLE